MRVAKFHLSLVDLLLTWIGWPTFELERGGGEALLLPETRLLPHPPNKTVLVVHRLTISVEHLCALDADWTPIHRTPPSKSSVVFSGDPTRYERRSVTGRPPCIAAMSSAFAKQPGSSSGSGVSCVSLRPYHQPPARLAPSLKLVCCTRLSSRRPGFVAPCRRVPGALSPVSAGRAGRARLGESPPSACSALGLAHARG